MELSSLTFLLDTGLFALFVAWLMVLISLLAFCWSGAHFILSFIFFFMLSHFSVVELTMVVVTVDFTLLLCLDLLFLLFKNQSCLDGFLDSIEPDFVVVSRMTVNTER